MSTITIIGNGNMGKAIGGLVSKSGNHLQTLTREDSATKVEGDIVVLAVGYPGLAGIVEQRGAELAGKVVVDIANPVDMATFDGLVVAADGSSASELAARLPEAQVVKAFNTNFAATLATGKVGEVTTTVLVAGDDAQAGQAVVDFVKAAGLNALQVGSLKRARELEAVGFLQIGLAAAEQIAWTAGFAVVA